jgi:hypothetical protein
MCVCEGISMPKYTGMTFLNQQFGMKVYTLVMKIELV